MPQPLSVSNVNAPQRLANTAANVSVAPPTDGDTTSLAWVHAQLPRLDVAGLDEAKAIEAQAATLGAQPGLTRITRARLELVRFGALTRCGKLGADRVGNGRAAFAALQNARALAPQLAPVVIAQGRTVLAMNNWGTLKRLLATTTLGIDLSAESRASIASLAALPDDPMAQLVRQGLAQAVGDTDSANDAGARLAQLDSSNPAGVATARASLAADVDA